MLVIAVISLAVWTFINTVLYFAQSRDAVFVDISINELEERIDALEKSRDI